MASTTPAAPARFALVGTGRRSRFFRRLAEQAPEHFTVVGVVSRSASPDGAVSAQWAAPVLPTLDALLSAADPEFVVACVPWAQAAETTVACVEAGCRVLVETPPAADVGGLRGLWSEVGASGLVQVAEQYLMMPGHAARLAVARSGAIGDVTSVQVSSTHLYHAVSMIRGLLGVGAGPVSVRAQSFTAPVVDPLTPDGWTGDAEPHDRDTTMATLDFGGGRSGLYDFTDNQWWNPLRARRIVVRGTRGEIVDDEVTRMADATTPVRSPLLRRRNGVDLDLEGVDLRHVSYDGEVLWRNPYVGARFSEDDIAVAAILSATTAWSRDEGPAPYPLAVASEDHLIGLAIGEAARTGATVTTTTEPWASSLP